MSHNKQKDVPFTEKSQVRDNKISAREILRIPEIIS